MIKIEEGMILRAIQTNKFYFLYCLWAFKKNFEVGPAGTVVFTFDYLFRKVIELCEDSSEAKIGEISKWRLDTNENFLRALLKNHMDRVAW